MGLVVPVPALQNIIAADIKNAHWPRSFHMAVREQHVELAAMPAFAQGSDSCSVARWRFRD